MRKWLNNYFVFSRNAFNGVLVLIFLIGLMSVVPAVYDEMVPPPVMTAEERRAVLQLLASDTIKGPKRIALIDIRTLPKPEQSVAELFNFDPNVIDIAQWLRLGLSEKQAMGILNYRNKGGRFYKPEDLGKMYTINKKLYLRLLPYVRITKDSSFRDRYPKHISKQHQKAKKPEVLKLVELNLADTLELDRLRGIGAVFARRIAGYRDRLGGFYDKEQLLEVFGIDSAKYRQISGQITIDPRLVKKINVNTAQYEDLKRHPYLRYKQINALIQYRKQHGNYQDLNDLRKVLLLSEETLIKLYPYFSF